ncbi:hypothetical protein AUP68_13969 [Ilyonectria robusta]
MALAHAARSHLGGLANHGMSNSERARLGASSEEHMVRVLGSQIYLAGWIVHVCLLWTLKAAMCSFYLRLARNLGTCREPIYAGFAFVFVTWIATFLSIMLSCRPLSRSWQISPDPGRRAISPDLAGFPSLRLLSLAVVLCYLIFLWLSMCLFTEGCSSNKIMFESCHVNGDVASLTVANNFVMGRLTGKPGPSHQAEACPVLPPKIWSAQQTSLRTGFPRCHFEKTEMTYGTGAVRRWCHYVTSVRSCSCYTSTHSLLPYSATIGSFGLHQRLRNLAAAASPREEPVPIFWSHCPHRFSIHSRRRDYARPVVIDVNASRLMDYIDTDKLYEMSTIKSLLLQCIVTHLPARTLYIRLEIFIKSRDQSVLVAR